jgi:hypothetical protein
VTLGDFWGVEAVYPELGEKQTDGVSMLLLNSPKARALDGMLMAGDVRYETVALAAVTRTNHQLLDPATRHSRRGKAYKDLRRHGFGTMDKWLTYGPPLLRLKMRVYRLLKGK